MAFVADLNTCEAKVALNTWVSGQADIDAGKERECPACVKKLTGAPQTSLWRRGKKVKGNSNILPGTAIATFKIMLGNGNRFRYKGHAAIFKGFTAGGIEVYDQWANGPVLPGQTQSGVPFHKRIIEYLCGGYISNDAEAFFVVELAEVPPTEPAVCNSVSSY